jgi:hypothetical protein
MPLIFIIVYAFILLLGKTVAIVTAFSFMLFCEFPLTVYKMFTDPHGISIEQIKIISLFILPILALYLAAKNYRSIMNIALISYLAFVVTLNTAYLVFVPQVYGVDGNIAVTRIQVLEAASHSYETKKAQAK